MSSNIATGFQMQHGILFTGCQTHAHFCVSSRLLLALLLAEICMLIVVHIFYFCLAVWSSGLPIVPWKKGRTYTEFYILTVAVSFLFCCILSLGFRILQLEKKLMVVVCGINSNCSPLLSWGMNQIKTTHVAPFMGFGFSNCKISLLQSTAGFTAFTMKIKIISPVQCHLYQNGQSLPNSKASKKKIKKVKKKEHHLWKKRESSGSGIKALTLVRIVSELPNEKEAVYGALDKWTAWETEFPLIAAAKALNMLRQRGQWRRVIQVAKWMLSKGQGGTMGTYDTLLLAFDKDKRADEAESLWNMILHTHTRSISKRLFSRMISLYDHHDMQDKIIDVFADMEELGVKPDEDTFQRVARAFKKLGEEEKRKLVLAKYQRKWKYIHFKGERVKVRRDVWEYNSSTD